MASKVVRQIVLEAGTRRKKDIRRLREGTGPLQAEVESALQVLQTEGAEENQGREVVPVVLLIQKRGPKRSSRRRRGLLSALLDL